MRKLFLLLSLFFFSITHSGCTPHFVATGKVDDSHFSIEENPLARYLGRPVVVHFWASWCVVCASEREPLSTLATWAAPLGVPVVTVAIDDTAEAVASLPPTQLPVILDVNGKIKEKFSITRVPTTIVLDEDGQQMPFIDPNTQQEVLKLEGPQAWTTREYQRWLLQVAG